MESRTGENEMTKKGKTALGNYLGFALTLLGLYFWYTTKIGGVIGFFVIFTAGLTIPYILISYLIPDKKTKKRSKNTKKRIASTKNPVSIKINKETSLTSNPYNVKPLDQLLTYDLKDLSGFDFEELCFQYFKHNYKYVEQTSYAKDKGVDFIFKDQDGFRVAVQVKHRLNSKNKVTLSEINELNGARKVHHCNRGLFITSAGYTSDALKHAKDLNIDTHAGTWVENKILRWREKEANKRNLA